MASEIVLHLSAVGALTLTGLIALADLDGRHHPAVGLGTLESHRLVYGIAVLGAVHSSSVKLSIYQPF